MKSMIFTAIVASLAAIAQGQSFFTIESVAYAVGDDGNFGVTICTNDSIAGEEATIVIANPGTETDVPGTQLESDPSCFVFADVDMPNNGDTVRYEMDLYQDGQNYGPVGFVVFEFRSIDNIASFDCNGQVFSRVAYIDGNDIDIVYTDEWNFNMSAPGAAARSICAPLTNIVYNSEVVVCQPGNISLLEMGTHYSNWLDYDGYYGFTIDQNATEVYTEAVIFGADGQIYATRETINHVPLKNFEASQTNYHVCTIIPSSDLLTATAAYQSSVQDLDVHGFTSGGYCFLNYDNKSRGGQYVLDGGITNATSVDCGRLIQNNTACFATTACDSTVDMVLVYAGGSNQIRIPQDHLSF